MKSPLIARLFREYVKAGDLYYQQGRLGQAIDMYSLAGQYEQAAKLSAELGHLSAAVDFYDRAGKPSAAGEILLETGDMKGAARYFERAGEFWRAAEATLALKQTGRAARLFERAGDLSRAAKLYEEAKQFHEAIRALEAEGDRMEKGRAGSRRSTDLARAELLQRIRRYGEAAAIHERWSAPVRAGELYEQAGDLRKALDCFLRANREDLALPLASQVDGLEPTVQSRLFERSGRHEEAATLLEQSDLLAEAAEVWERGERWERAATLWEQIGQHDRAAELFSRVGDLEQAARAYESARRLDLALGTWESAGRLDEAARCALALGRHVDAAELFLRADDRLKAAEALQMIGPSDPDFGSATLRLVPLLVEDGLFRGALHRLRLLPEESSDGTGTVAVERYYWEGRALEGLGRHGEAVTAYERAAALRRDHRDVKDRLRALRDLPTFESGPLDLGSGATTTRRVARTPSSIELQEGSVLLDRYEIQGLLGRGGMSRVYRARDRELEEIVAIKTLLSRHQQDEEERLLREVQISRRITHPNVVRVYDMGRYPGGIFVTMELIEGFSLQRLIKDHRQLPLPDVKRLLGGILAGLEEAHRLKIIHRDLKPANVMLSGERVKLLDFGIARMEEGDLELTRTGEAIGSPKYMSPEQLRGEPLDARTDLYALGVLAYALLAGREPFTGRTANAVALKHLQEPPPDITELRPDLPLGWRMFLSKLLAKKREDRYGSATELLKLLPALPD